MRLFAPQVVRTAMVKDDPHQDKNPMTGATSGGAGRLMADGRLLRRAAGVLHAVRMKLTPRCGASGIAMAGYGAW
jgi:hypothetical protein